MFTDSPEGQTHSFNDGCGMPEHNMPLDETIKREVEGFFKEFPNLYLHKTHIHDDTEYIDVDDKIQSYFTSSLTRVAEAADKHEGCYCVCQCPVSSCPSCKHCIGAVEVAASQAYLQALQDLEECENWLKENESASDRPDVVAFWNGYTYATKQATSCLSELRKKVRGE